MMPTLLITADDFGIGPETSRGILDLAERGIVTSTVLLANSPHAEAAVHLWRRRGQPVELGWHPTLTLDAPISPAEAVPSLVDTRGQFQNISTFLKKLIRGRIPHGEIETELQAQYDRFLSLTGFAPRNVNGHHHIHIFAPVHRALTAILSRQKQPPHLRRIVESKATFKSISGARFKRFMLNHFGQRMPGTFPANDFLLGVTDSQCVQDPEFFRRWLDRAEGSRLELTCQPGHFDATLIGRGGTLEGGQLHRRAAEYDRLIDPALTRSLARFELISVSQRHRMAA